MPRVPTARVASGQIPFTPTGSVAASVFGSLAELTGQAADVAMEYAEKEKKHLDRQAEDKAVADFIIASDAESERISKLPIPTSGSAGLGDEYNTWSQGAVDTALSGIDSEDARNSAASKLSGLRLRGQLGVTQHARKRVHDAGVTNLKENLRTYMFAGEPDHGIAAIMESGVVNSESKPGMVRDFLSGMKELEIQGQIDSVGGEEDETIALAQLEAIRESIDDEKQTPHLTPETRISIRENLRKHRARAHERFNKGRVFQFRKDLTEARTTEDFDGLLGRIDQFVSEFGVSEAVGSSLYRSVMIAQEKVADAEWGQSVVAHSISTGTVIPDDNDIQRAYNSRYLAEVYGLGVLTKEALAEEEPTDSPEGDPAVSDTVEPTVESDVDPAELAAAIDKKRFDLISGTDTLPQIELTMLDQAAAGDDPGRIAAAVKSFRMFRRASPRAVATQVDSRTNAFLDGISVSLESGVRIQDAIKRTRELQSLSPEVVGPREKFHSSMNRSLTGNTDADYLAEHIAGLPGQSFFGLADLDVGEIEAHHEGYYSRIVKRYYTINGDLENARRIALDEFFTVFGTSNVGGQAKNMLLSPEVMFPAWNRDSEAITANLVEDLRSVNIEAISGISDEELSGRLLVVPDADSFLFADVPEYSVYLVDADNPDFMPTLLMHDENLSVVRYTPIHPSEEVLLEPDENGRIPYSGSARKEEARAAHKTYTDKLRRKIEVRRKLMESLDIEWSDEDAIRAGKKARKAFLRGLDFGDQ